MDFIIFVALALGCCCGIVTGLVPGIHVNTVAALIVALSPSLAFVSPLALAVFLIALAITHSFLDFIPSIFLGAPDPDTALSVLPGHSLLREGRGFEALKLTVVGGLGAFLVCLAILPLLFLTLKPIEPYLRLAIPFILIGAEIFFVMREGNLRKAIWAAIIFLLAGTLGLLALNNLNLSQPMFPLLAGIFGISTSLLSVKAGARVPEQKLDADVKFISLRSFWNYLKAAASSLIVSILPGIGSAQAAGLAQGTVRPRDREDYLMIVGGINTAGVVFTLAALYLLGKARSGAVAAIRELITLDSRALIILICTSIAAAGIAAALAMHIGKWFAQNISKINYGKISLIIIIFVSILVAVLSGPLGLLVMATGAAIGLISPLVGVRRIHAMGALVLVVLTYFI